MRGAGSAPPAGDLVTWLRTPRRLDAPGVYGFGHRPHTPERAQLLSPDGALLFRAGLCVVLCWLAYRYLAQPYTVWLAGILPADWQRSDSATGSFVAQVNGVFYPLALIAIFAAFGRWPTAYRRYLRPIVQRLVEARRARNAGSAQSPAPAAEPDEQGAWRQLRSAGQGAAADLLEHEVRSGRLNDVDYVRISRVWDDCAADPRRARDFADSVAARAGAAWAHPSGQRDMLPRLAEHDLLTRQTRIGVAFTDDRTPLTHRGARIALDPSLLGTNVVAVGPPGSGKTRLLTRRIVEGLHLQALAGLAAVLAVGGPEADLGPAGAFDVLIAPGSAHCPYSLDLYGRSTDPDEAAAWLADALLPGDEGVTARTALQQLLAPFHAGFGRYPRVRELRDLLEGSRDAFTALRAALQAAGRDDDFIHDLRSRWRQQERPDDPGAKLAARLAHLDRPAFTRFFDGSVPSFSPRLDQPLRVRVVVPERTHPEAAGILCRLAVSQFLHAAASRGEHGPFACLVVDDASPVVEMSTVRGLQRLRTANAGAVLCLRTLTEFPGDVRGSLLAAAGCRIAFSGLDPRDGRQFADGWGTVWVDEESVTRTPDTSGGLLRKGLRGVRGLIQGAPVQKESVTTRQVERPRWSDSELAYAVPAGHAVVSLTSTDGRYVAPFLVDLRG